ncbi:MAG: amino acid permease [Helicobacter sp.]|nr:amino acid permease [Helicobacter sp.]
MLIFITAFGISKPHILAPSWATYTSVSSFFGTFGGAILGISVCGAILSGINGFFIVTSKMLESLSIHHYLPQSLMKKNRFGVSYPIVCIVGFLSCLMVIFGRQSLLYIVDMACVGIIVGFLYVSSIAFLFKKRHLGYFSLSSFLSVILSIVFLLLEFLPFSPAALKLPSIIALVIWSGIGGIILYVLRQKM